MEPDAKTFYLLNVFVALLSGGASLAAWLDHRDIPGLRAWAVGLSVGALGAMMLGLCPPDSSCVLTIVAATLIVGGYATLWMGVRQFNEGSLDMRYALLPVIVFLALTALAQGSGGEARTRSLIAATMMAALALLAAWETFRASDYEALRSRLPAALAFVCCAVDKILQAASLLLEGSPALDLFHGSGSAVMLFTNTLCMLTIIFGLLMMANERLRRRFEELASTDPLTGLPNRRFFVEKGNSLCRRATDNKLPTSVLMMDLDHFSGVNGRFGHHGGDRALAAFAALAREQLSPHGLIARYGGEEFCALLCEADGEEASRIAEGLRAGVAAISIDIGEQLLQFTVSIGLAPLADGDLAASMRRADAALYRAKALGRNQVCSVSDADARSCGELAGAEFDVATLGAAAPVTA